MELVVHLLLRITAGFDVSCKYWRQSRWKLGKSGVILTKQCLVMPIFWNSFFRPRVTTKYEQKIFEKNTMKRMEIMYYLNFSNVYFILFSIWKWKRENNLEETLNIIFSLLIDGPTKRFLIHGSGFLILLFLLLIFFIFLVAFLRFLLWKCRDMFSVFSCWANSKIATVI